MLSLHCSLHNIGKRVAVYVKVPYLKNKNGDVLVQKAIEFCKRIRSIFNIVGKKAVNRIKSLLYCAVLSYGKS